MNTILLLKSDYERIGGPESLLRSLGATIDRDRFDPVLAILRRPKQEPMSAYPDCLRQVELPWRGFGTLLATAKHAARIARETNSTVVHSHDMRANAVAATMRLFHDVPWIAHIHGWLGPTHSGRWRVYEGIDRRLVRSADRVLVGSSVAQREVRACGAKRVDIVPNAVAIPDERSLDFDAAPLRDEIGVRDGAVILGMLGRLHFGKGHEIFLQALAALVRANLNVHGLIVGEGQDSHRLRTLADTLGIADRVTFTGFVDDAIRYLRAMDVVAVPSLKDSLPLTALEAMSFARPVVASCTGDLPLAIEHGVSGLIVPIGDSTALAERLAALAVNRELRLHLGAAGRRRVIEAFSAHSMARGLEQHYMSVIRASNSHGG
jgi:glycosyltransferase involved in cell wall biosynthesis